MNLCSGGKGLKAHKEIVYESRNCPFCEYMEQVEGDLNDLRNDLEEAQKQIEKLEEGL